MSIATTMLWNRCRVSFGLPGDVKPYLALHPIDFRVGVFGDVFDEATAQADGYHQPWIDGGVAPTEHPTPTENLVDWGTTSNVVGAPQDAKRTVKGHEVPQGGCAGAAFAALGRKPYLSLDDEWNYGDKLQQQVRATALKDPSLLAAGKAWSTCMSGSGYSVATPTSPRNVARGPQPSAAEIAEAVADVSCQRTTRSYAIAVGIDADYERQAISLHHAELDAAKAIWQGWVNKAKAILAAG